MCSIRSLVMQTCARRLLSPATCHLQTLCFTAESFALSCIPHQISRTNNAGCGSYLCVVRPYGNFIELWDDCSFFVTFSTYTVQTQTKVKDKPTLPNAGTLPLSVAIIEIIDPLCQNFSRQVANFVKITNFLSPRCSQDQRACHTA